MVRLDSCNPRSKSTLGDTTSHELPQCHSVEGDAQNKVWMTVTSSNRVCFKGDVHDDELPFLRHSLNSCIHTSHSRQQLTKQSSTTSSNNQRHAGHSRESVVCCHSKAKLTRRIPPRASPLELSTQLPILPELPLQLSGSEGIHTLKSTFTDQLSLLTLRLVQFERWIRMDWLCSRKLA
jgi:hypothetical protein